MILTRMYAYVCVDNTTSPVALPVSFSKLARTSHGFDHITHSIARGNFREIPSTLMTNQAAQAASHPS